MCVLGENALSCTLSLYPALPIIYFTLSMYSLLLRVAFNVPGILSFVYFERYPTSQAPSSAPVPNPDICQRKYTPPTPSLVLPELHVSHQLFHSRNISSHRMSYIYIYILIYWPVDDNDDKRPFVIFV